MSESFTRVPTRILICVLLAGLRKEIIPAIAPIVNTAEGLGSTQSSTS